MCGVAGFYSRKNFFKKDDLKLMANTIEHRGPDADGFFSDEFVGLAHRRLKIIDLSEGANQPMVSGCGRYVMVYNGEVYNFKEIQNELDVELKTTSDTEVILEAFVKFGASFVNKLNGMFSIIIYDKETHNLYIFRDRIGIKPLYLYNNDKDYAFASELKSIVNIPIIKDNLKINKRAISNFLNLGYIPEPDSIYEDIHKFPSGSYAIIDDSGISIKKYWNPEDKISNEVISDCSIAKNRLKGLIEKSVSYRLMSDVPFGTFLSGGIDSSLVTAVAQKQNRGRINTFSIGFGDVKYNESEYAKKIAKYLGTNHHELMVSYNDAIDLIPSIIDTYDEPYADSSAIPTMLVSKMAKQFVTMTLSGDGGDELFHGYGAYNWANRLSKPVISKLRKPIALGLSKMSNRHKRASKVFKYTDKSTIKSHIFSQEQYLFSRNEISKLLTSNYTTEPKVKEIFNLSRKLNPAEEQAFFDMNYYLKDDLLVKVDRASMKYSLETRVPILDHNIIEFALNVSPDLKIKNGVQKYLLKEVLYDYVPAKYFARPKWGFSIPLQSWLKNELKYLIDNYLNEDIISKYGVVNYKSVKTLKKRFFSGHDYLYNRLWLLICLHRWLDTNHSI